MIQSSAVSLIQIDTDKNCVCSAAGSDAHLGFLATATMVTMRAERE
ncbi:MAG: hypothetical protein U0787_19925 [Polyangia bacterium]